MAIERIQNQRRLFLKQVAIGVGGSLLLPGSAAAFVYDEGSLPRSSPEAQGISSADILRFVETAETSNAGLHSLMVIRHGYVVAEGWWAPYSSHEKHWLYSLSKNFVATAIGMAIDERMLHLDNKVISFFPNSDLPSEPGDLPAMKIRDLLTMSSGHAADTFWPMMSAADGNWAKTFFAIPLQYKPGTRFVYNSGATYMLSAILEKAAGESMINYLQPRLFAPLGIYGAEWDKDPKGIAVGAAGLRLKTEDIAKFSQLYLQKGVWKGKRILSEKWIDEATSFKISNHDTGTPTKREEDDIKQGYGYHFWMSRPVAQGAYRSEGAFCQYSIVLPKQDAVIAITAEGISTKRVMDLTWSILLPAMTNDKHLKTTSDSAELKRKLKSLALQPSRQSPDSSIAPIISGKKFVLQKNALEFNAVTLDFYHTHTRLRLTGHERTYEIDCGKNEWRLGKTVIPGSPPNVLFGVPLYQKEWKIAASGTWADQNTYVMTWRFYESPHADIVTCRFNGEDISIEFANSVSRIISQYKDPRPALNGRMVG